jgi:hypothetical protein
MARRSRLSDNSIPPALSKIRQEEAARRAEASEWIKSSLQVFFSTQDAAYTERTTAEVLEMLDRDPEQPLGYASLNKPEAASYRARYDLCRNTLEALSRRRVVAVGTTINAKGREGSITYARARDASEGWQINLKGPRGKDAALTSLREWLRSGGDASLSGIDRVTLVRKPSSTRPMRPGSGVLTLRPIRRRGRPPGSKNKPKASP